MNSRKKTALLMIRIFTDLIMVSAAWIIAYYLRFYSFLEVPKGVPSTGLYFKLIPFIAVIWLGVLAAGGFYRRTMRQRSAFVEALDIIQSCIFATLAFIAFSYFYEEYRYSRVALVIFALLHPWLVITGRSIIRKLLRLYRRRAMPKGTLIIGAGDLLTKAFEFSQSSDLEPTTIKGVILAGNASEVEQSQEFCQKRKLNQLSVPKEWAEFFTSQNIQSVYLAIPNSAHHFFEEHLDQIAGQLPDIKIIPDFSRYTRFTTGIDLIRGTPVLNIHESPLEGFGSIIKRVVDIIGSSVGIILFAPVMLLVTLAVKITSRGPILYRQERMGLDGKTFYCLKFRSMPIDAENKTGPVWATPADDRATPIGKALRKYSLDELPQFFNVFKGDMSLVGPRPERPVFVNNFRKNVPGYMLRHKVKAGLTGWAQVNGWRGNTSIEKRIECDLFYIQNWSLWLDVRIIGRTVAEVVFGKNAY